MKLRLAGTIIAFFLMNVQTSFAQTMCDDCPPPQVVLYGIQMLVPQPPPDDSLGQYTTASSRDAFLNWLALEDAIVSVASIENNDPEKSCVTWLGGTMAQELAANPDTSVLVHVQNYSTGDIPPSGQVAGVDYLIWSTLDSSGGQYTIEVYLEDAYSRTRIASGSASFTDPNGSTDAAASAVSQIEPVFEKIRAYQKQLRDQSDEIAISAKIDIVPSKDEMNGGETIPVLFQVYDCDGAPGIVPLTNRWIKISATQGQFDQDSVETDSRGDATAYFTAENVKEVANLTATYYPYYTPSHKTRGSWGDTTVNINLLPNRNWVMDVKENYFIHEHIVDEETGSYYLSNTIIYSNANVRQYFVGDLTDTSVSIDEVVGGKGSTSYAGDATTIDNGSKSYLEEVSTENGTTSPDEDFKFSIGLGDVGKSSGGITFSSELLLNLEGDDHIYDHESNDAFTYDTPISYTDYPDPYVVFSIFPSALFPGHGSFTRTDSGFIYAGTYIFDTTEVTGTRKDMQHRDFHVTAIVRPYQKPNAVKAMAANIPTEYSLSQNYPNPFNPSTRIDYQLPRGSFVTIKVYDILGREVRTLVAAKENPGRYAVAFDASGLSSGVYYCRMSAVGNEGQRFSSVKKLTFLK